MLPSRIENPLCLVRRIDGQVLHGLVEGHATLELVPFARFPLLGPVGEAALLTLSSAKIGEMVRWPAVALRGLHLDLLLVVADDDWCWLARWHVIWARSQSCQEIRHVLLII